MPCYTVTTVSADLAVADEGVLTRSLAALGHTDISRSVDRLTSIDKQGRVVTITQGRIEMRGVSQALVDATAQQITQAYGRQAVQMAAKMAGFGVVLDKKDANHFTLSKGGF